MEYVTSDLYFAAFLTASKVERLQSYTDGSKVKFVFTHPGVASIRELKRSYFSGSGMVSALLFAQALKSLKSEVNDRKRIVSS